MRRIHPSPFIIQRAMTYSFGNSENVSDRVFILKMQFLVEFEAKISTYSVMLIVQTIPKVFELLGKILQSIVVFRFNHVGMRRSVGEIKCLFNHLDIFLEVALVLLEKSCLGIEANVLTQERTCRFSTNCSSMSFWWSGFTYSISFNTSIRFGNFGLSSQKTIFA